MEEKMHGFINNLMILKKKFLINDFNISRNRVVSLLLRKWCCEISETRSKISSLNLLI